MFPFALISLQLWSKLITFYLPWNHQKTIGFTHKSYSIRINLLNIRSQICTRSLNDSMLKFSLNFSLKMFLFIEITEPKKTKTATTYVTNSKIFQFYSSLYSKGNLTSSNVKCNIFFRYVGSCVNKVYHPQFSVVWATIIAHTAGDFANASQGVFPI